MTPARMGPGPPWFSNVNGRGPVWPGKGTQDGQDSKHDSADPDQGEQQKESPHQVLATGKK